LAEVRKALRRSRVVAMIGPRQSGKTTLARMIVRSDSVRYFDLESPRSLARLDQPMAALEALRGVVAIDEIQRKPDLFPVLRVLSDRRPLPSKFLVLGSASPMLLKQSSESLAGRIETVQVPGLSLEEVGVARINRHWLRGGFPLSYVARSEADSFAWRSQFIQTFLERDLPQLGISIPAPALLRFWTMVAHSHGGIWSAAEPARSLGIGETTVRSYLDLFTALLIVRQLQPWHENLTKRQVKSPKVYLRDSGLLHALLGIRSAKELLEHPKCGASWEGYAIDEILKSVRADESYFWATHQGAELDLLLFRGGRRIGIEIKRSDAPKMTPSIRSAMNDLRLDALVVIYPGREAYALGPAITVMPLAHALDGELARLMKRRRARQA
jgi:predicted AAA+ superfamily ATPase